MCEDIPRVIEWLTGGHLEYAGGYPYDFTEHEGRVFIATLPSDNETRIDEYDISKLATVENSIDEYLKENKATGEADAIMELIEDHEAEIKEV